MINRHLYFSQPPWLPTWPRIFAENLGKVEDGFIDRGFGGRKREESSVREKCKLRAMRLRSSLWEFVPVRKFEKNLWKLGIESIEGYLKMRNHFIRYLPVCSVS